MPKRSVRSPRTKSELLDKILSYNFDGDLRHLAPDPSLASIQRAAPNVLKLDFRDTDAHFELVVRKPRQEMQGKHGAAKQTAGKSKNKKRPARSKVTADEEED